MSEATDRGARSPTGGPCRCRVPSRALLTASDPQPTTGFLALLLWLAVLAARGPRPAPAVTGSAG